MTGVMKYGVLLPLLFVSASAQECFIPGSCVGNLIGAVGGYDDPYACLELCQETSLCTWFTADTDIGLCELLSTCTEVDETCDTCVSGEVICPLRQCGLVGQCQDEIVGAGEANSHQQCQEICDTNPDCSFYSFDYEQNFCYEFSACSQQSSDICPRCISGQPGCGIDRFLMVVGGTPDDDSVEVVSLDANFPVPSCLQELGSFPDGGRVRGAGAALLPGGVPHVCGGDGGTSSTDSCFEFNFSTLTWSVDGTMPGGEREDVAHAHSAEWGLVMAGGTDSGEDTFYDSVLTTADGASFGTDVPDLPVGTDNACLVVVDAERLFFAGGVTEGGSTADAYLFSRATQEWTAVGEMPGGPKDAPACGLVRYSNGDEAVVIASSAEVDIYDLTTGSWRTSSNALGITGAVAVPYGNTFITVGGYADSDYVEEVMLFNPEADAFQPMEGVVLQTPKRYAAAMLVDALSFECVGEM